MAFKLENIPQESSKRDLGNEFEKLLKKEISFFGSSFASKKKFAFYNELGVLLQAGIAIREALILIKESQKKENDKILFETILKKVVDGIPLSDALQASKYFTDYEYFSLKIGEETGTLSKVCKSLAVFFERKIEQNRIIVSALTYPAIVLSTAVAVIIFMLSYVVPMFQDIFRQNKIELPLLTRMIISISDAIKNYGWLAILFCVGLIIVFRLMKDNYQYRKFIHYLLLKTPVIGGFISKIYLAQFTQAVSLLVSSKVPILNSIQMVKKMIGFIPLEESLQHVEDSILKGKSLSESLKNNRMFDNRIVSLIKVAEETNQTEFVFNQLNEQYNQEVIQQSKTVSTFLEPFIILIVGTIIGILLIAMYLPMFKLSSAIG